MRRPILAVAACLALARPLAAQGSPIVDLLLRARVALNDLRMAEADSLGMMVLAAFGPRLTAEQRLDALNIMAAARYPEAVEGITQQPDSALSALRAFVRTDPTARLRGDLTWPGLDSLYALARRSTFAVAGRPQGPYVLTGPGGAGTLEVVATRPARFAFALVPDDGGATVAMDTAGPTDRALLRLRGFIGQQPLAAGAYSAEVRATDAESGDVLTLRYRAVVASQALEFAVVPELDESRLLPETAPPARARGIVAGLLLGGATVAGASAGMPTSLSSVGTGTAMAAGAALGVGAVLAGFLDRGRPLPENAAANLQLRASTEEAARQAVAENRRRVDTHQVTITLQPEAH